MPSTPCVVSRFILLGQLTLDYPYIDIRTFHGYDTDIKYDL